LTHAHQETIDDAREQAEFEYEGINATWAQFD
jgi:hypothetical protein